MSLMAAAAGFSCSVLVGPSPPPTHTHCGAFSSKVSYSPEDLKKIPSKNPFSQKPFLSGLQAACTQCTPLVHSCVLPLESSLVKIS